MLAKLKNTSLPLAMALFLSACSNTAIKEARDQIKETTQVAESHLDKVGGAIDTNAGSPISYHEELWLGDTVIENIHGTPFHARFQDFTILVTTPLTFEEAIDRISSRTGIPFIIEDNDLEDDEKEPVAEAALATDGRPFLSGPMDFTMGVAGRMPIEDDKPRFRLSYQGPLDQLISRLTSSNGMDWVNEGGKVRIFKYLTRTFSVAALPGDQDTSSALKSDASPGDGGSGAGASSGGTQVASTNFKANTSNSTTFRAQVNFWGELTDELATIVGDQGKYSVSSSRGRVTVTATRETINRVENFLVNMNNDLVRQVVFNVKVLNVSYDNSDRFGANVIGNIFGNNIQSLVFSQTKDVGAGLNGLGVNIAVVNPTSKYTGTQVILSALSERDDVSTVNSSSVTTLNHVPAPVQVVSSTAYLQSIEKTISSGYLSATSLTPGNVTTGFTLKLLPNIFANGQIMVQYSLTLSDLLALDVFGTGDKQEQIQLPQVSSTAFIQHTLMQSGQALVLAGFERMAHAFNKQTPLPAGIPLLGGSYDGTSKRQMIVIIIEPNILQGTTFSTRG